MVEAGKWRWRELQKAEAGQLRVALTGRRQSGWVPAPRWEQGVYSNQASPTSPQNDVIQCLLIRDSCVDANANSQSIVNANMSSYFLFTQEHILKDLPYEIECRRLPVSVEALTHELHLSHSRFAYNSPAKNKKKKKTFRSPRSHSFTTRFFTRGSCLEFFPASCHSGGAKLLRRSLVYTVSAATRPGEWRSQTLWARRPAEDEGGWVEGRSSVVPPCSSDSHLSPSAGQHFQGSLWHLKKPTTSVVLFCFVFLIFFFFESANDLLASCLL